MFALNIGLALVSTLVSLASASLILKRFAAKGGIHLLLWGLGAVMYGLGGLCEALYGLLGWSSLVFRLWYLFGAVLVAAWLGQGTVYLLLNRTAAHVLMAILLAGSIYAAIRVFGAQLDPARITSGLSGGTELSGQAIVDSGVRAMTPWFNIYGTVALVGGALWSVFAYWRKRPLRHRMLGSVLIALGALFPALSGALSRFGVSGALYLGEALGAILILLGFLRAVRPMKPEIPTGPEAAT